tara:strand:+ start:157 stop:726 length:570 start_codon:yes stop_codon:yes gene_type:complete
MINNIHHTIQEFALNDSIHLILFFTLLSTFYFYYVTDEEEHAQVHLVKQLLRLKPQDKPRNIVDEILFKVINNYPSLLQDLKKSSEKAEKERHQKNLVFKKRTYYSIIILFVFLTMINIIIKIYYGEEYIASFTKILIANIISVVILGIVEFIFFTVIVKNYNRMGETTLLYQILKDYDNQNKNKKDNN